MSTVRQSSWVSLLAVVALGLMVGSYFTPLWWVSLTAPNYPPDVFPDGIKIQFSLNGVSNGCSGPGQNSRLAQETQQEDLGWRTDDKAELPAADNPPKPAAVGGALDCMHEMNTINHYVGMHPIGIGAPVERHLSKFIVGMFAVMLLAFALGVRRQTWVLGVGFVAVSAWMVLDLYVWGGLDAFVTAYMDDAGKYFRETQRIANWGDTLRDVTTCVAVGLMVSMAFITVGAARWPRFQLLLTGIPMLLPVFFVGIFAAWLWFFGHHLHPMGAFTIKPFMPTVFGDGKVAQFSTHSYPHFGFALVMGSSVLLAAATLRRRLELLDNTGAG